MKTSTAYFSILIVTIAIVAIGFFLPISDIKNFTIATYNIAFNPWIALSAAACSFIFLNNKHYWLINIAGGILTGILTLALHHKGLSAYAIIIRATAFLYICYILNYIRYLIGK